MEKQNWCVVGNIKNDVPFGPGGIEKKSGVKQFKAGARVEIIGSYNGSCESIIAIGQHRKTGKFIHCVIKADVVQNLRVKLIYRPQVLEFLAGFKPNGALIVNTKQQAEDLAKIIPRWANEK